MDMHLHHQSQALGKRPFLPHPASQARGPLLHATGQASYPQATKRIQVAPREPGWGVIQPTNQAHSDCTGTASPTDEQTPRP